MTVVYVQCKDRVSKEGTTKTIPGKYASNDDRFHLSENVG